MKFSQGIVVALAVMALAAGAALGAEDGKVQAAAGMVVAVTEGTRTIVVESRLAGQPWIIGAEVTDQTKFGGKAGALKDVKAGDQVTIRWIREENRLAAQSILLQ
jgi:ribosomal protein S17